MEDKSNPSYYKQYDNDLQVFDGIVLMVGTNKFGKRDNDRIRAFCQGNIYKYSNRAGLKDDPMLEYNKVAWYRKMLDEYPAKTDDEWAEYVIDILKYLNHNEYLKNNDKIREQIKNELMLNEE